MSNFEVMYVCEGMLLEWMLTGQEADQMSAPMSMGIVSSCEVFSIHHQVTYRSKNTMQESK